MHRAAGNAQTNGPGGDDIAVQADRYPGRLNSGHSPYTCYTMHKTVPDSLPESVPRVSLE